MKSVYLLSLIGFDSVAPSRSPEWEKVFAIPELQSRGFAIVEPFRDDDSGFGPVRRVAVVEKEGTQMSVYYE